MSDQKIEFSKLTSGVLPESLFSKLTSGTLDAEKLPINKTITGTVDRTYESDEVDAEITVTLETGYKIRFWLMGLSDDEYIRRARILEYMDKQKSAK